MFTNLTLLALLAVPAPVTRSPVASSYRPRVELWTNRGEAAVYTRGERVRVFFQLDGDAYVTVFRIDTDGRVRVLFPREPWDDNFVRGDREFEIESRTAHDAFTVDDYPGVGYVFAVASADPFVFTEIESGGHWDYRVIAGGRVRGDPYVALTDLAQRIVPEGYADWDYDLVSYNVERHYSYPRFLCYDCHTYVSYPYWDPYGGSCVRFRMVVYDDPYYYPYRYYGGRRVVFVRPYRPQPRFIFKDWGATRPSRDQFVTRERERPVNDNRRRGVTGRDVGGSGVIPPPVARDRRDRSGQTERPRSDRPDRRGDDDDDDRDRGRRDRPDRPGDDDRDDIRDRGRRDAADQGARGRPDRPTVVPPSRETRPQAPRGEPRPGADRTEPRRGTDRPEPRRDAGVRGTEPRRDPPRAVEPRRDPPRAEPRRDAPRAEPRRDAPRAEPQGGAAKDKPRSEPELRRRKP